MIFFRPGMSTESNQSFRWSFLSLHGPDAQDFLHRLSTVRVKALKIGQGAPGCFLTPQGKLRASFYLWRDGETHFTFEFDAGQDGAWKRELLAFIDQYTFAEKMTLSESPSDLECIWLFPEESEIKTSELKDLGEYQIGVLDSHL